MTLSRDDLPETLNGYPVDMVQAHDTCATVRVIRGDPRKPDSYVVATWWPDLGDSWAWGHYFHGPDIDAESYADFNRTARRNSQRN